MVAMSASPNNLKVIEVALKISKAKIIENINDPIDDPVIVTIGILQ